MSLGDRISELRGIDIQNPAGWPEWIRVFMSILMAVVLVALGTYQFIRPKTEELATAQADEQTLRVQFEQKQQKVAALDAYKEQLKEMERIFGDMLKLLPSKAEIANLLNEISQTRVASSLEEELFQPMGENQKEFYAEIPNKIVVTGAYHEMGNFVSGVAALPRIVTVEEIELKPENAQQRIAGPQNQQATEGTDDLRMTALAKTYRYLDDQEIAAAEAARRPQAGQGARR